MYMPGRTFEDMQLIRKWIEAAILSGEDSPARVLEWIEQRKSKDVESPAFATVARIMREMGYEPVNKRWEKKGKNHE
jgi:hypothetical protein